MRPRRLPEHASATGLTVARRVRVRAEELLTDYRTVCSELYARTVGAAAADERRRLLSEELRSAEASVAQLRRELDRLPDE